MQATMTTKQKATTRSGTNDSTLEHGLGAHAHLDHVDCNDCLWRMVMTLRELMIEYICFAFSDEELMSLFQITDAELAGLSDMDLLEIYDQTLLAPVAK